MTAESQLARKDVRSSARVFNVGIRFTFDDFFDVEPSVFEIELDP